MQTDVVTVTVTSITCSRQSLVVTEHRSKNGLRSLIKCVQALCSQLLYLIHLWCVCRSFPHITTIWSSHTSESQ